MSEPIDAMARALCCGPSCGASEGGISRLCQAHTYRKDSLIALRALRENISDAMKVAAVKTLCGDTHLCCTYPDCACKAIPKRIEPALADFFLAAEHPDPAP